MTEHRILLVREWDAQAAASGCCGRIGGEHSEIGGGKEYAHNRLEMERMGEVYRALREELFDEDVEITVVDPRNALWLLPNILRDARRGGLSMGEMLRSVKNGISYNSIIFDGKVLFSGRIPRPEAAVAAIKEELKRTRAAHVS